MALTPLVVKDGNNAAASMNCLQDLAGYHSSMVSLDSTRQTYRVAASFTPYATGALAVIHLIGSATKTVRVKRVLLSGTSTGIGSTLIVMERITAVGTGGTAVTPAVIKMDTASAAATAVVKHYTTAAESRGTGAGTSYLAAQTVQTGKVAAPEVASVEPILLFPERGAPIGQAIVLRGASEILEITNLNAGNLPAGTIYQYMIEWEEDAS